MDKHICPVCKKEFYKKVYKICQSVYCSPKCAYIGRSLGFTKRIVKEKYKCFRKAERNCEVCQTKYIYRKKTQQYCSRKCYEIALKKRMIGINNPAWKNGSSYKKRCYRGNDWETLRQEIYKRDNYTCQDCGIKCESKKHYKNADHIIQCHHIENYKNNLNNTKNNLITLCLKCHLIRHNQKKRVG